MLDVRCISGLSTGHIWIIWSCLACISKAKTEFPLDSGNLVLPIVFDLMLCLPARQQHYFTYKWKQRTSNKWNGVNHAWKAQSENWATQQLHQRNQPLTAPQKITINLSTSIFCTFFRDSWTSNKEKPSTNTSTLGILTPFHCFPRSHALMPRVYITESGTTWLRMAWWSFGERYDKYSIVEQLNIQHGILTILAVYYGKIVSYSYHNRHDFTSLSPITRTLSHLDLVEFRFESNPTKPADSISQLISLHISATCWGFLKI